jgi:anaerobic selenocysteine-containing dehydrogenase
MIMICDKMVSWVDQLKSAQEYPVQKVSEITWIPVDKIESGASLCDDKTGYFLCRVAVEHNTNSTQSIRRLPV